MSDKPLQYALIARAAYATPPTYGSENSAARAIVSTTDDGEVVAFPGSNNLACWLADLNCDTTGVDGLGKLHEGFYRAFSSLRVPLMDCATAVTCGHSEGAALALIYAAALCLVGKPPKMVFAFEPPRVTTDPIMRALFEAHGVQVYLYKNGNDVVPDVPRLIHDWQHPGDLIRIGKPCFPFPNIEDHEINMVVAALG